LVSSSRECNQPGIGHVVLSDIGTDATHWKVWPFRIYFQRIWACPWRNGPIKLFICSFFYFHIQFWRQTNFQFLFVISMVVFLIACIPTSIIPLSQTTFSQTISPRTCPYSLKIYPFWKIFFGLLDIGSDRLVHLVRPLQFLPDLQFLNRFNYRYFFLKE
jgi:hypothetical protein